MKFLDVEKYTPIQKKHEAYLKELVEYCKDTPRHPSYHIHPPCGLVNDPNGLAYFGGKYHVFYQWFPFGPEHGMKHWAHVISEDLIKWEWSDQKQMVSFIFITQQTIRQNKERSQNRQWQL